MGEDTKRMKPVTETAGLAKQEGLTGKRIRAVLFSVLPMVIYFTILILLTVVSALLQVDYDRVYFLINTVSLVTASAVMCVVLRKRTGKRLGDALVVKDFDFFIPLLALLFSWCAGEVLDGTVAAICSNFFAVTPNATPDRAFLPILQAIVIAPVMEEIIFRYLGTEFAREYFPLPCLCVANAVYFALPHGYNIQGFCNLIPFSICMVCVYVKTGRLLYVILIHMLHNIMCLPEYGDILLLGNPIYREKNGFTLGSPQWMTVNLVVAAACVVIYFKKYGKAAKSR